ncbi:MAG TPA: LytTR family DNA-binding domain-containing protein [Steroidobacteraceae bacterium]|nr:LytTR family DNA-binding domain-containing protein [Steroidobacteraceae bacterium]
MSIRAVIIDDEPYARERLRELCALEPDLAVVGEASHGVEAVQQVEAVKPDLLLLDVQMRGANGFGVLQRLKAQRPLVVFVTAYDQYALEAFDCDAVDYLLKPFDRERFQQAIRRVRARLSGDKGTELADRISSAVRETVISVAGRTPAAGAPRRIVAEREGRLFFIAQPDIDSVEANRNYVNIRAGKESFTIRWTMQQAESTLDPAVFLRVHRSVIVNTHKIREMERWFHGEYIITLNNGQRFTSGRAYRQQIQAHVKNSK